MGMSDCQVCVAQDNYYDVIHLFDVLFLVLFLKNKVALSAIATLVYPDWWHDNLSDDPS